MRLNHFVVQGIGVRDKDNGRKHRHAHNFLFLLIIYYYRVISTLRLAVLFSPNVQL